MPPKSRELLAHDEPGAVKKSGLRNSPSQRDSGSLALDIVGRILPVVFLLFCVRLLGIFIGAFRGGLIAGDPLRYNHTSWMALITQAGIGIGLAKELAIKFPEWGHTLATVVISVIVLNQIVEPPFFKLAIRRVGESHLPRGVAGDRVAAVILGIAGQSIALARQLRAHN